MSLQAETGRRMREFEEDSTRLSFLAEQMEQELEQSTNAEKISMLRNMNSALRETIRGIDRVKSCMQIQTTSQTISSLRYKTQVKLYSLDTYSEVTQNNIPSTLLKMENKFLHEKAQRCILKMQLRWLQDVVDEYLVFLIIHCGYYEQSLRQPLRLRFNYVQRLNTKRERIFE